MKTTIKKERQNPNVIRMADMEPCQMGWCQTDGELILVMRTACVDKFEVMDLTNMRKDSCWDSRPMNLEVELLTGPVTITFDPS